MKGLDFVVLDTETTGLDTLTDRIVQIGAAVFRDGELLLKASRLCNPGRPMPEGAGKVNGLTDAMLAYSPTFRAAWRELMDEVIAIPGGEDRVLVAHNKAFDQPFILTEGVRHGCAMASTFADEWLCTMAIAKQLAGAKKYDRGFRLVDLCDRYGVQFNGEAHDAANDAEAAGRLLFAMSDELPPTLFATQLMVAGWYARNR